MKRLALTIVPALALMITTAAQAQPVPSSGMLLGIYAFPNWQGLRVTSTIPGFSAQGRLFPGDVLRRVTADGVNIFETRQLWQFEMAKDQIGPFRPAALEVFRPGQGLVFLWVEFRPVGGAPALRSGVPVQMKARVYTEQERPGCRALFQGRPSPAAAPGQPANPNQGFPAGNPSVRPMPQPQPNPQPMPMPVAPANQPANGQGGAASLFGR